MTAVDVDALDKLREAATAGPWVLAEWSDATILAQHYLDSLNAGEPEDQRPAFLHTTSSNAADAALIAAAVNALPELLAEVRRGRALREAVLSRHERVGGDCMDCGGVKWPCPTVALVAAVDAS